RDPVDRAPVPASGRDRHAVLRDRRLRVARRQRRHRPRPRLDGTGPRQGRGTRQARGGPPRLTWTDDNKAWWDERVPLHVTSDFYQLDEFRSGGERLRPYELDEVGVDPDGLDLLHLQCHIGTD